MAKSKIHDLSAQARTEFGKGAARRTRRAGRIPAVIYGTSLDAPIHVSFEELEFNNLLRYNGLNTLVNIDVDGEKQLAMIKSVDQNVLTFDFDHADLLAVAAGETVEVEIPVIVEGEGAPGTMIMQEADAVLVEAPALSIPDEFTVSVEALEVGAQITAADIKLPKGVTLSDESDLLLVNVVAPEDNEAEADEAAAEVDAGQDPNNVEATEESSDSE